MRAATDTVVIEEFPQLKLIAWNRNPRDAISGEDAFDLYERNWRFIDEALLEPRERALVERLARDYGHGILHV